MLHTVLVTPSKPAEDLARVSVPSELPLTEATVGAKASQLVQEGAGFPNPCLAPESLSNLPILCHI